MSVMPESEAPKPLGYQLQEITNLYENLRDKSAEGAEAGDHTEYAETLDALQGDDNREKRLAYLAQLSGVGELELDEYDEAHELFDSNARERFGWIEHQLPDGTSQRYRLGTVLEGVMTLTTLEDEDTHGSFFDDSELIVGPDPDGNLYIVKYEQRSNVERNQKTPTEEDIQTVRDAIIKLREVTAALAAESDVEPSPTPVQQ